MRSLGAGLRAGSAASAVGLLLVAPGGCSDDGPAIDPEADVEVIEDVLLSLDDLPDGFVEVDVEESDVVATCDEEVLGVDQDVAADARTAGPASSQFEGTFSIQASVTAFESAALPRRVVEGFHHDEYLTCLGDDLLGEADDRLTLRAVEPVDALVDEADGVESAAIAFRFEIADGSRTLMADAEVHVVLAGRFVTELAMSGLDGAIDHDLVADALEAMLDRLERSGATDG